jgi:hypothetical protein
MNLRSSLVCNHTNYSVRARFWETISSCAGQEFPHSLWIPVHYHQTTVLWDVTLSVLVEKYQGSEGTCHLHLPGRRDELFSGSSEMLVPTNQTRRRHIPEELNIYCIETSNLILSLHVLNNRTLDPIMMHMNLLNTLTSYCFKINFNVIHLRLSS